MVSLSNDGLCNGVLNGKDFKEGSSITPKWKIRKVSAFRDFPPGCGPKALKTKAKSVNDVKKNVSFVDSVKSSENCYEPLSREKVKSPSELEMSGLSDDLVGKVVALAAMPVNVSDVSSSIKPLGDDFRQPLADELGAQNNRKLMFAQDLPISDANIVKDPNMETKYPRRRVSATREFPPFCGRNAPHPSEEDRAQITKDASNKALEAPLLEIERGGKEESGPCVTDKNHKIGDIKKFVPEEKTKTPFASPVRETRGIIGLEDTQGYIRENGSPKRKRKVHAFERKIKPKKVNQTDYKEKRDVAKNVCTEIVVFADKSLDISQPNEKEEKMNFVNNQFSKERVSGKIEVRNKGFVAQELGEGDNSARKSSRKKPSSSRKRGLVSQELDKVSQELDKVSQVGLETNELEVTLPPFGPNNSSRSNTRNKVRETLRLFQAICRKILQGEEANPNKQEKASNRIDLEAAKIIKTRGKEVNTEAQIIGSVPGIEVGDEFMYRVELALVGVHRLYQAGIDYVMNNGMIVCVSIVASGGYADEVDNPDVLIYSGQGGMTGGKKREKQAEDQKLERGNLALKNSIEAKNPIRVIRGTKEKVSKSDSRDKMVPSYAYDGLYIVEKYWQEVGHNGKLVFKFELRRIPGQPELSWKEVKKSKKFKSRECVCVEDISNGKEVVRICAVNTVDNEKPPVFNYITKMIYPSWYSPTPPEGCGCVDGCSDSQKCLCVIKNGDEIPYNHNGAIVEAKSLVHECGPSCKCPPSCYNRVTQHGMKIQLEIFKTESRGWGVRSLSSIPSGSFICEYIGELLDEKEAEQRCNDEYLFDIGQNYTDCSQQLSADVAEEGTGFTIDAAVYGNVGRFINHSCSPNLYAQNVVFDHEDKSMPHIMLFAVENIPALQELTYHYNYSIDQVRDSDGNVIMKSCYCGSEECTGRMY